MTDTFSAPKTERTDHVDTLHSTEVRDPYRYLENSGDQRTKRFIEEQASAASAYLAELPERERLLELTTQFVRVPVLSQTQVSGARFFALWNDGSRDQAVIVTADSAANLPRNHRVLLDPLDLRADGTIAVNSITPTADGRLLGISLSEAGSDWSTLRVMDVETGELLDDRIDDVKFSDIGWLNNGTAFVYSAFDRPTGDALTEGMTTRHTRIHTLGTPVADDVEVASDETARSFEHVTGNMIFIDRLASDADGNDTVAYFTADGALTGESFVWGNRTARNWFSDVDGNNIYISTNLDAPKSRLVRIDAKNPDAAPVEILPERPEVLVFSALTSEGIVAVYSRGTNHFAVATTRNGTVTRELPLPENVSVISLDADKDRADFIIGIQAWTTPATKIGFASFEAEPETIFSPENALSMPPVDIRIERVPSTGGAEVPLTIVRRKDQGDGPHPTLVYGYGGFNIELTPTWNAMFASWVAAGGTLAVANLRGGGEFGHEWYRAGTKERKQNVFDDLYACAEWMLDEGYADFGQLTVHGRSNGGLLTGAALTQRPDLWGAALPTVGVLDMLRYHLFTGGRHWLPDYGDPETAEAFAYLREYSPLHNIVEGTEYPPTLVSTGDHDDRVVPAHSFKFAAELQHAQADADAPVVLRIDTRAGHGMGKPKTALAAEYAEQLAFAAHFTGLTPLAS